jgi:hypothetical protein
VSLDVACECLPASGAIGNVELQHACAAPHPFDSARDGIAFIAMRMTVDDDIETVGGSAQGNRATDAAARTCD